ncbi:MAG: SGNH/GDSL hydrolase family protein [Bacteroidales bacterium]|nr:SGNH/GDSL hydrolase family protein [Bacteroidales bacterium]
MRGLKIFIINVIILILIDFILGLVIIPDVLESDDSNRVKHEFFHHGFKPDTKVQHAWANHNKYTFFVDSLGLKNAPGRHNDLTASNKRRIMFMGDSFVETIGMPYRDSFFGVLENKYISKANIDLINGGVASMSPKLYYLRLKYYLDYKGMDIDELFVFVDISDPQDEIMYKGFLPSGYNYKPREKDNPIIQSIQDYLRHHSFVYYTLYRMYWKYRDEQRDAQYPWDNKYNERFIWMENESVYENWGREGLQLCEQNMKKLVELCRNHGINDIHLVVYPWPYHIERGKTDTLHVLFWKKFARDHGLDFINFYPLFIEELDNPVKKYYIPDDMHWNKQGHQLIAKELAKHL